MNPLLLALQSGDGGAEHTAEGFSMLSILLAVGEERQSPLLYAIGIQDRESGEDLLMARANVL